jgi:hypothetical protein
MDNGKNKQDTHIDIQPIYEQTLKKILKFKANSVTQW